jgi:hypothetical protein
MRVIIEKTTSQGPFAMLRRLLSIALQLSQFDLDLFAGNKIHLVKPQKLRSQNALGRCHNQVKRGRRTSASEDHVVLSTTRLSCR